MQTEAPFVAFPSVVVLLRPRPLRPSARRVGDLQVAGCVRRRVGLVQYLVRHEHGLLEVLYHLMACPRPMSCLLVLKRLVMRASWGVGQIGPLSMMKRLRGLLMCLIDQLVLLLLRLGLLVCGIFDVVTSIWIRQRRGLASELLELRSPGRLPTSLIERKKPSLRLEVETFGEGRMTDVYRVCLTDVFNGCGRVEAMQLQPTPPSDINPDPRKRTRS